MTVSVAAFANLASSTFRSRLGFEASQVIETPGLRIEAHVRRRDLRTLEIEYKTYQSSWIDLQEALTGQVEFVGTELCGLAIHYEGAHTWIADPASDAVLRKPGCHVFEPIPGLASLGELSFLGTLTQDFLLRDLGEQASDSRTVRRIAIKPKQVYRSQLLNSISFPIRKATIDFDVETYFPLAISFTPSNESPAASIIGPNATIRITYKDVSIFETPTQMPSYSPPADAKVFEETAIGGDDLAKQLPYSISEDLLAKHGFDAAAGMAVFSRDTTHDRSYATIQFPSVSTSSPEETAPPDADSPQADRLAPRLTLIVGNYVSRLMARRRATFSESGHPASDESLPIKLLDRKKLWEERFPGIDSQFAPVEAFFEREGIFWFLSGTGMDLNAMETIAKDLMAPAEAPSAS